MIHPPIVSRDGRTKGKRFTGSGPSSGIFGFVIGCAFAFASVFTFGFDRGRLLPGPPVARWGTSIAFAAEARGGARAHFRQGETHYAAGKYGEALAAYKAGYDVEPLPGFLVNIAQCQRRMGDLERARATYGKFIVVAPDSPLASEVRGLIQELDRLIAEAAAADRLPSAAPGDGKGVGAKKKVQTESQAQAQTAQSQTAEEQTRSSTDRGSIAGVEEILPLGASEPALSVGTAAGADLVAAAPGAGHVTSTTSPSRRRWWLWASVGTVVVAAAAVALFVVAAPDAAFVHDGTLGTLRR